MRLLRRWRKRMRKPSGHAGHSRVPRVIPPEFLHDIPRWLEPAQAVAARGELETASAIRQRYLFDEHSSPFLEDIVRAFRLAHGVETYAEIGTYDRGNLAYVSTLAAPDALLIGVDIDGNEERSTRLRSEASSHQRVLEVEGSSQNPQTVEHVRSALDGRALDLLFIDGHHAADSAMADYGLYAPMVRPGGLVFFHDVYWRGSPTRPGVTWALQQLDRLAPIHVVFHRDPVHRFLPWMNQQEIWGGVGIVAPNGVPTVP